MAQSVPDSSGSMPASYSSHSRRLRPWLILPIALVLMLGGVLVVWYSQPRSQTNRLRLSGRIEGYETDVAAQIPGRIISVAVREGDPVRAGELIVQLEDTEVQAQLDGVTARLSAAQQREQNAELQLGVIESQILEAQLTYQQAQGDARGQVLQAEEGIAEATAQLRQAEAQVTQAQSQLELARANRNRIALLAREGAVPQQQFDEAQTVFETAQANLRSQEAVVEAARRRVLASQGNLTQAQTSRLNPDIRSAQISRFGQQLKQAQVQLVIAEAEVASAEADRQEILARLSFLSVTSPIEGVVVSRSIEPGTVVSTGQTLVSLLDLNTVYMRGFIPEGEIGHVRVGQRASVYLDSAPNQSLEAEVTAIDSQASFTPENIYFQDDRVRQVFGVKLSIENPDGFAKPGMPADAEIWLSEDSS